MPIAITLGTIPYRFKTQAWREFPVRRSLVLLALTILIFSGCGKNAAAPTAPIATSDPIPPMSRYDTLYVFLGDDGLVGDKPWTVSTQDTSVIVTASAPLAAIIYDTRDSLFVHVSGWRSESNYPPHQLISTSYAQAYPPQDSTWRLPNARVDPCMRIPLVLAFSQWRHDYEVCNVIGQCIWNYELLVDHRAFYWDVDRSWPPGGCSP